MYYDENGNLAKSGKVDQLILNQVIDNFKMDIVYKPAWTTGWLIWLSKWIKKALEIAQPN